MTMSPPERNRRRLNKATGTWERPPQDGQRGDKEAYYNQGGGGSGGGNQGGGYYQPLQPKPIRGPAGPPTGLDITAFVLAFFFPVIGAILGMVAESEAHKANRNANGLAVAAVWLGCVFTVVAVIVIVAVIAAGDQSQYQQYLNCLNSSVPQNCTPPGGN